MTAALCNMGLPMLALFWPASFVLFVPIVLTEALVGRRILQIGYRRALVVAFFANLFSTLLALPLTWGLMLAVQSASGLQSAWIFPTRGTDPWVIPRAAMIMCVPAYFASVVTEYLAANVVLRNANPKTGRWAWTANAVTYAGILVWLAILGVRSAS